MRISVCEHLTSGKTQLMIAVVIKKLGNRQT